MGNISALVRTEEKIESAVSFMVKNVEYYLPLGSLVNIEEEIEKLQKELDYSKGFLNSTMKKLGNERFVNNAPEAVVAAEKKKLADTEVKIAALEQQITSLKG